VLTLARKESPNGKQSAIKRIKIEREINMSINIDNIASILWFLLVEIGFFYMAYKVWFKTSEFQKGMIKMYERLPKWFPFRDFYIDMYNSRDTIFVLKIAALLISILLLAGILFMLYGSIFMQ
jgi:hypothetical protein